MEKCNIYNCNIYIAQKYIKHKWIPIIIYILIRDQKSKFSDFLSNIEYISNKRLSASLQILIDNKLIAKDEADFYILTPLGKELAKIIELMSNFEGDFK